MHEKLTSVKSVGGRFDLKIMKELFKLQSRETFEEIRSAGRMGTGFVERRIFVKKKSLNNW